MAAAPAATASVDAVEYEAAAAAVTEVEPTIDVPAMSPTRDSVVGTSRNEDATLALTARSGPNGEDPEGQGVAIAPNTRTQFDVTCLHVMGTLATVGVVVTRSTLLAPGTELLISIRDTTLPGGEGDGHSVIAGPAATCAVPLVGVIPPHEHGNWVVEDAIGSP